MSNHYTRYAFVVPMTQTQAKEACNIMTTIANTPDEAPDIPVFAEMCQELATQFGSDSVPHMSLTLRAGAGGLLIASLYGETPPFAAAIIVQALLNHFDIDTPVGFEAAEYSDRMVVDGYGGLAVWVTKTSITDKSTSECLQELRGAAEKAPR